MPSYTLRIYQRRRPHETVGTITQTIDLAAQDNDTALTEAEQHLGGVNFDSHFAALMSDAEVKFLTFWHYKPGS